MAQTPVTLNDPEGHFGYLALFNSPFGKCMTCIKFDMCSRIEQHNWPDLG